MDIKTAPPQLFLDLDLFPGSLSHRRNSELPMSSAGEALIYRTHLSQTTHDGGKNIPFTDHKRVTLLSLNTQVLIKDLYTRFIKCSKKLVI